MTYNAAYAEGVCLINQLTVDDRAAIDEKKAIKLQNRLNRLKDKETQAKELAIKKVAAETSQDNWTRHIEKSKSLIKQY
jgi:predicted metal-binding protein